MLIYQSINSINDSTLISILPSEHKFFQYEQAFVLFPEFLAFTTMIFGIGLLGIIYNYKNFLVTMMSIELMYLGIISSFIGVSVFTFDPQAQVYALLLLVIAASESAVGLGILVVLYRFGKSINFEAYQELRG